MDKNWSENVNFPAAELNNTAPEERRTTRKENGEGVNWISYNGLAFPPVAG